MNKRWGVAFGGGGARGLAHIGVLRALRSSGLAPPVVAGSSAGSIVAALYAASVPQAVIEEAVASFDWFANVIDFNDTVRNLLRNRRGGLLSNSRLRGTVNKLLGGRGFDDLDADLAITATDLEARQRVIFTSKRAAARLRRRELNLLVKPPLGAKPGIRTLIISDLDDVGEAVRASCAIPGLFQPVLVRGMRLLDGGIVSQVPVDVLRALGAKVTVGISLGMAYLPQHLTNAASAIAGMVGLLGVHQLRPSLDLADVGFQIKGIERHSIIRSRQLELIALGERDMAARITDLRSILHARARRPQDRSAAASLAADPAGLGRG